MEVVLNKDWNKNKKGDTIFLQDVTVANKGLSIGLFKLPSEVKEVKAKKK